MKNKGMNVHTMTRLALLIALELVMAYTPLGMIPIGPINASLLTIPVAIGAMLIGPTAGVIMGAIFGLTSFWNAVQGKSAMGVALMAVSTPGYALQAIGGRILCGLCTALIFAGVRKLAPKRKEVCVGIGALACPLLNTLFFMGFMMLLFYKTEYIQGLVEKFNVTNPVALVIAMVGTQGLVEAITCTIVATAVTLPLMKYLKMDDVSTGTADPYPVRYVISFFVPVVGFILGAILLSKDEAPKVNTGKQCTILAAIATVIYGMLWYIL